MTQDEIIDMARQCSFTKHWEFEECLVCNPDSLYHFAKLVAVAAASKEREACAKVCEDDCGNGALNLAAAIRARGNPRQEVKHNESKSSK